jgi:hypothetical protein
VSPTSSSIFQVLILSAGVYLVLGFLRTTRGTGLVRGLAVTALVGVLGLYALSAYLELDELDYLFEISSPDGKEENHNRQNRYRHVGI